MYHPPWVTYESHYGCYSPDPSWMNSSEAVSQGSGSCSYPSTYHGDPMANPHGRDSATGRTLASSPTPQLSGVQQSYSVYLKVLSPANKKDFSMFTLRNVNPNELSTLDELKEEIFVQCGEGSQLPRTLEFKIGYFRRSQKLWINNKHDLDDGWDIIRSGERLTLWALGIAGKSSKKRTRTSFDSDDDDDLADR